MSQPPNNDNLDNDIPKTTPPKTPFERSRFGGTTRPHKTLEDEVPVSKSDLGKGAGELSLTKTTQVNWSVLIVSSVIIAAFSVWAMVMPAQASATMELVVNWIASNLGWYYVLTMALVIFFVVWVALSKAGSVRLGPDDSRPQYGLATWGDAICGRRWH